MKSRCNQTHCPCKHIRNSESIQAKTHSNMHNKQQARKNGQSKSQNRKSRKKSKIGFPQSHGGKKSYCQLCGGNTNLTSTCNGSQFPPCIVGFREPKISRGNGGVWRLLFVTHEWTTWLENFRTIRRIFVHDATVAEFLNETFFPLDIGVRDIADFVGMEAVPMSTRH
jgi:hypothetical protein